MDAVLPFLQMPGPILDGVDMEDRMKCLVLRGTDVVYVCMYVSMHSCAWYVPLNIDAELLHFLHPYLLFHTPSLPRTNPVIS